MFGRLKYWLLTRLCDDICRKSECDDCELDCCSSSCYEIDFRIKQQARIAWNIE